MTKTKKSHPKKPFFKQVLPYFAVAVLILAVAFFGSFDKNATQSSGLDLSKFYKDNFRATTDQVSEYYLASSVAESVHLPTAEYINTNYNSVVIINKTGQVQGEKLGIQYLPNVTESRGIIKHEVKNGENLDTIANQYGVTVTQIRWSNNLRTTAVNPGTTLYIPKIPGIIYVVKNGDTIESLAKKYQSSATLIMEVNDLLKISDALTVGASIVIPSGQLPENERPEYVAPRQSFVATAPSRYYLSYSGRNPMAWGWCTWYAWQRRYDMGRPLPSSGLGNANTWDDVLGFNYTPAVGAVFQTDGGWYGHVGIVDSVNSDGSITVSDMNGFAGWGAVGTRTLSRSEYRHYKFIH